MHDFNYQRSNIGICKRTFALKDGIFRVGSGLKDGIYRVGSVFDLRIYRWNEMITEREFFLRTRLDILKNRFTNPTHINLLYRLTHVRHP